MTFRPLGIIGVNRDDGIIDIYFNEKEKRIEEWFIFTKRRIVNVNSTRLTFAKGDRVLLSITYKPKFTEIQKMVQNSGWRIECVMSEENQMLFLLSPVSCAKS